MRKILLSGVAFGLFVSKLIAQGNCNPNSISGFYGTEQIVISNNTILNSLDNSFTIECWFKPQLPTPTGSNLIRRGGNWLIQWSDRTPVGYMWFGSQYYLNGNPINDTFWHHVALSYSGDSIRLYQDGLLVKSVKVSGDIETGSEPLSLGNYNNNSACNCLIDEVRLWDRALNSFELQSKMKTQLNPASETELVGYWQLNLGNGSTTLDLTNNKYNAVLTSNLSFTSDVPFDTCTNLSNYNILQSNSCSVFPNPTNNSITIKTDKALLQCRYLIFDNTGRLLIEGVIASENTNVNLTDLKNGIYSIIVSGSINQTIKFVKL